MVVVGTHSSDEGDQPAAGLGIDCTGKSVRIDAAKVFSRAATAYASSRLQLGDPLLRHGKAVRKLSQVMVWIARWSGSGRGPRQIGGAVMDLGWVLEGPRTPWR